MKIFLVDPPFVENFAKIKKKSVNLFFVCKISGLQDLPFCENLGEGSCCLCYCCFFANVKSNSRPWLESLEFDKIRTKLGPFISQRKNNIAVSCHFQLETCLQNPILSSNKKIYTQKSRFYLKFSSRYTLFKKIKESTAFYFPCWCSVNMFVF